jgi:hypothetical protein
MRALMRVLERICSLIMRFSFFAMTLYRFIRLHHLSRFSSGSSSSACYPLGQIGIDVQPYCCYYMVPMLLKVSRFSRLL